MTHLAFDPSSTITGWAVLREGPGPEGTILDMGIIRAKSDGLARQQQLAADVREVYADAVRWAGGAGGGPLTIVIERPEDHAVGAGRQNFGRRGFADLATYGRAVGCVEATILALHPLDRILSPCPSEWVGRGRGAPSSRGDEHKEKRVKYVEWMWKLEAGALGCKTNAGNVADAVLLAHWSIGMAAVGRMVGAKE